MPDSASHLERKSTPAFTITPIKRLTEVRSCRIEAKVTSNNREHVARKRLRREIGSSLLTLALGYEIVLLDALKHDLKLD